MSARGLASASPEVRKRVAQSGGWATQKSGRAHKLTSAEKSRGGKNSSTNFARLPLEEVQRLARLGGKAPKKDHNRSFHSRVAE